MIDLKGVPRPIDALYDAFRAAVRAASPSLVLGAYPPLGDYGRIAMISVGKAAAVMAAAMRDRLSSASDALLITGHDVDPASSGGLTAIVAGHPLPNTASATAAQRALSLARELGEGDLLLLLVSGGATAMLCSPPAGVALDDLNRLNEMLLRAGMPIGEMNVVRRHLCQTKGGRLAAAAWPARTITFAMSDVPDDVIGDVGSGPGVADPTTLAEARAILKRYEIVPPESIACALIDEANETPTPGDPRLARATATTVVSARHALDAAEKSLSDLGYHVVSLGHGIAGDARETGFAHARQLLALAEAGRPVALLSGGETTVRVRNRLGRGGRNKTYLLAAARALDGNEGVWGFAADTDGIDGTEDDAGAWFGPETLVAMSRAGCDPVEMDLADRSFDAFAASGNLIRCGPTGANVNDLRVLVALPTMKGI